MLKLDAKAPPVAETANRSRGSGRAFKIPQPDIIEHFGNADAVPQNIN